MHCFILKHLYTLGCVKIIGTDVKLQRSTDEELKGSLPFLVSDGRRYPTTDNDEHHCMSVNAFIFACRCPSMSYNGQRWGVQPHLGPWPSYFWSMAMGLSGPTFFIASLVWKCDETNFKLILRKKVKKKK